MLYQNCYAHVDMKMRDSVSSSTMNQTKNATGLDCFGNMFLKQHTSQEEAPEGAHGHAKGTSFVAQRAQIQQVFSA